MFDAIRDNFVYYIETLGPWSYAVLVVLVFLEGPVFTILAGAASSAGLLNPGLVFLVAGSANLTADCGWYAFGRIAPLSWIMRFGRFAGMKEDALPYFQARVEQHAPRLMFLAKMTWIFATTVLFSLGMSRVPLRRWLPYAALAECLWTGTLVLCSFLLVQWITTLESWMQFITIVAYIALFFVFVRYVRRHATQFIRVPEDAPA